MPDAREPARSTLAEPRRSRPLIPRWVSGLLLAGEEPLRRSLWTGWLVALATPSGIATAAGLLLLAAAFVISWVAVGPNMIGFAAHGVVWAIVISAIVALSRGLWLVVGRYRVHAERVLLTRHLCPTCGYGLSGVAHARGLVVCPECGSRWRQGRVGGDESEPSVIAWEHPAAADRAGQ